MYVQVFDWWGKFFAVLRNFFTSSTRDFLYNHGWYHRFLGMDFDAWEQDFHNAAMLWGCTHIRGRYLCNGYDLSNIDLYDYDHLGPNYNDTRSLSSDPVSEQAKYKYNQEMALLLGIMRKALQKKLKHRKMFNIE